MTTALYITLHCFWNFLENRANKGLLLLIWRYLENEANYVGLCWMSGT